MFRGTLLCFILCPLPLFLPLGTQVLSLFCSLHPHIHPSDSPPWDSQLKPGPSFLVTKQLQWQQISRNQPATQKLVPSLGQNVSLFPTPIPLLAFTILEEKDLLYGNSDLTDLIPSWFSSLPATTRCGRTVKKFLQVPEKRLLPKMKHFPATGNVFWEKKKKSAVLNNGCLFKWILQHSDKPCPNPTSRSKSAGQGKQLLLQAGRSSFTQDLFLRLNYL